LNALRERRRIKLPAYDKSLFDGQGDRADDATWAVVNQNENETIDVIVLEGWCVGFCALSGEDLEKKWRDAKTKIEAGQGDGQLGRLKLENVGFINEALKDYQGVWRYVSSFH
jgi:D-glycerate 3-kinase